MFVTIIVFLINFLLLCKSQCLTNYSSLCLSGTTLYDGTYTCLNSTYYLETTNSSLNIYLQYNESSLEWILTNSIEIYCSCSQNDLLSCNNNEWWVCTNGLGSIIISTCNDTNATIESSTTFQPSSTIEYTTTSVSYCQDPINILCLYNNDTNSSNNNEWYIGEYNYQGCYNNHYLYNYNNNWIYYDENNLLWIINNSNNHNYIACNNINESIIHFWNDCNHEWKLNNENNLNYIQFNLNTCNETSLINTTSTSISISTTSIPITTSLISCNHTFGNTICINSNIETYNGEYIYDSCEEDILIYQSLNNQNLYIIYSNQSWVVNFNDTYLFDMNITISDCANITEFSTTNFLTTQEATNTESPNTSNVIINPTNSSNSISTTAAATNNYNTTSVIIINNTLGEQNYGTTSEGSTSGSSSSSKPFRKTKGFWALIGVIIGVLFLIAIAISYYFMKKFSFNKNNHTQLEDEEQQRLQTTNGNHNGDTLAGANGYTTNPLSTRNDLEMQTVPLHSETGDDY